MFKPRKKRVFLHLSEEDDEQMAQPHLSHPKRIKISEDEDIIEQLGIEVNK